MVSGFHIVEAQQPGVVMINIRGIGQSRFGEAPIAMVVDGVQQVSPNQLTQDLFDIEQIEFLKGPQGALYGRNALGGAINIVTRKPGDDVEGSIQAGYAEGDDWKVGAYISAPFNEKIGVRVAASHRDRRGQIYNTTAKEYVDFDTTTTARGSILVKPDDGVSIDISGSYMDQKGGAAYYVTGPANAPREPVTGNLVGVGERTLADASVKMEFESGDIVFQTVTAFSSVKSAIFEDLDWVAADLLAAQQLVKMSAMTQELRLSSADPTSRLRWVAGLYFLHTNQNVDTTLFAQPDLTELEVPVPLSITPTKDTNYAYAAFGQMVYQLTDQLEITGALRYDIDARKQTDYSPMLLPSPAAIETYRATFKSLQPKASIAYKFGSGDLIYATVAKGFRSGGFNSNSVVTRKYLPESLWNYELGGKFALADRKLLINGAIFYTDITDRQVYGLDLRIGAAQFIANPIPKSHIKGAELEITAAPVDGLQMGLGGTLLKTKIDKYDTSVFAGTQTNGDYRGNRLNQVPEWSVNASIQYRAELGDGFELIPRLELSGNGGDYYWEIDNLDRRDDVWLANARITLKTGGLELTAYVTNLFDKAYDMEYVSPLQSGHILGLGVGARNAPRQVGVTGRYKF
jgi:iron complex outermembrane receptor protein